MELLNTDHTVTEVAMNSGFSDSNYFKDAFKKMYGVSPRAYRKMQKETVMRE
jgi:AraC-like DNA-binding protein